MRLRSWPASPPRPALPVACVQSCAAYLAALGADGDGEPVVPTGHTGHTGPAGTVAPVHARIRLAASLGTLLGANAAPESGDQLFGALLRAGSAALEAGGGERELTLALGLADTGITLRRKSKGAWRLRAAALEALGRGAAAAGAYERYLELAEGESADSLALHLDTLKERQACLAQAAALVSGLSGDRAAPGTPEGEAFAAAVRDEAPPDRVRAAFTACVSALLRARGARDPAVRRLAACYAAYCRLTAQDRMADPLLGGAEPLGVGDFRNLIAGRGVCVVANAPQLAGAGLGARTEAYEVVVRLDDFAAHARDTGERTDVHAVFHRNDVRRGDRVGTRLVFGDPGDAWQQAVRRLAPGAQRYVGDASLRRPVADPALIGERGWGANPTTGFTMLRLLDFLDVSPRIDLIGFGLPGQVRTEEWKWVVEHAKSNDGTWVALR